VKLAKRESKMAEKYIVILQQVIRSPGSPVAIDYSWDGKKFSERRQAISHGFETRGSDDFNLGILSGQKLVAFSWMDESVDDDLTAIAEMIGLKS
jgi:hypothetical protein